MSNPNMTGTEAAGTEFDEIMTAIDASHLESTLPPDWENPELTELEGGSVPFGSIPTIQGQDPFGRVLSWKDDLMIESASLGQYPVTKDDVSTIGSGPSDYSMLIGGGPQSMTDFLHSEAMPVYDWEGKGSGGETQMAVYSDRPTAATEWRSTPRAAMESAQEIRNIRCKDSHRAFLESALGRYIYQCALTQVADAHSAVIWPKLVASMRKSLALSPSYFPLSLGPEFDSLDYASAGILFSSKAKIRFEQMACPPSERSLIQTGYKLPEQADSPRLRVTLDYSGGVLESTRTFPTATDTSRVSFSMVESQGWRGRKSFCASATMSKMALAQLGDTVTWYTRPGTQTDVGEVLRGPFEGHGAS